MAESQALLESPRAELLRPVANLKDMRPGPRWEPYFVAEDRVAATYLSYPAQG
jgi:hypothetical protein